MISQLEGVGKPVPTAILCQLKRSDGMVIRALALALGMSYMGVKKPCLDLVKQGYLKAVRKPGPVGRPELVYRLTEKGHDIFPTQSNDLTLAVLSAARELFGPSAPGKLLYVYFRDKEKHYAARIRGSEPIARARWYSRERDKEGFLCTIENAEAGNGFRICERHSPVADIMAAYPETKRMEADMIERLLQAPTRSEPANLGASRFLRTYLVTPRVVQPADGACQRGENSISCAANELGS